MQNRIIMLGLATVAGLGVTAGRCHAAAPVPAVHMVSFAAPDDDDDHDGKAPAKSEKKEKGERKDKDDEKDEDRDKGERKERKEIETDVPMSMVPQAVIDAVMKECPGGKITESELEAKHGKIMYGFDVTVGDMKYDVNISVTGKFISKKVDDDGDDDEKDDHKPAPAAK
jgi:uncharacterized membrane protein YkoI